MVTRPLTGEEMEVCEEILKGETPRVAFRRITGLTSEKSLKDFLRNDEQLAYMAARRAELRIQTGDEDPAEKWLVHVNEMAYFDPADIVSEEIACPADILKLPPHARKLINGWSYDKAGNFLIKFVDRRAALDMLARYWGMYQAERPNDRDPEGLMAKVFWRYVMTLHLHGGLTIPQAMVEARRDPDKVNAWARVKGLLPPAAEGTPSE